MSQLTNEPNVTSDGKTIKVKHARLADAKADLAKRVVRLSIEITLDDAVLAYRDDFGYWKFDATPIELTLTPVSQQLAFPVPDGVESVTLSGGGRSVTLGKLGEVIEESDEDS